MKDYRGKTPQAYLELRKFVDRHITNSSTDFFSG